MDKRIINEEQFRKLVIIEAKKILSEEDGSPIEGGDNTSTSKRRITFDKVESLIKEMEQKSKSIKLISLEATESFKNIVEINSNKPNRDFDVIEHNHKKNINHINEGEKDKWNRVINYQIPSDENR